MNPPFMLCSLFSYYPWHFSTGPTYSRRSRGCADGAFRNPQCPISVYYARFWGVVVYQSLLLQIYVIFTIKQNQEIPFQEYKYRKKPYYRKFSTKHCDSLALSSSSYQSTKSDRLENLDISKQLLLIKMSSRFLSIL